MAGVALAKSGARSGGGTDGSWMAGASRPSEKRHEPHNPSAAPGGMTAPHSGHVLFAGIVIAEYSKKFRGTLLQVRRTPSFRQPGFLLRRLATLFSSVAPAPFSDVASLLLLHLIG